MKELIIRIDDELYRRAKESVDDLESALNERVTSYLKSLNGDDERIAVARSHMKELFNLTKGFGVGRRPSREEMHERESLTGNRVPLQADSTQWIHSLKRCKMAMK